MFKKQKLTTKQATAIVSVYRRRKRVRQIGLFNWIHINGMNHLLCKLFGAKHVFEDFRQLLQEACRIHVRLCWHLSDFMAPSYSQKSPEGLFFCVRLVFM